MTKLNAEFLIKKEIERLNYSIKLVETKIKEYETDLLSDLNRRNTLRDARDLLLEELKQLQV